MKMRTILALPFALLLLFKPAFAAQYDVTYKGISAGEAELSINVNSSDYHVELGLFPVMLAKMSGVDDMVETAKGSVREGHFYPHSYRRTDKDGTTLLQVSFNNDVVNIFEGDEKKSLTILPMGQDPLSQIAQIQYDLSKGKLSKAYTLVTENNQRSYAVMQQGQKVILTETPSKRRQLHLWFDGANQLVKMEKHKAGKVQFSMQKKQINN